MPSRIWNSGVANFGGNTNVSNSTIGSVVQAATTPEESKNADTGNGPVGVITILPVETMAVRRELDLRTVRVDGVFFDIGPGISSDARVVATQAAAQGQRSISAAFGHLFRLYQPAVVLLCGIGGGIHPDVRVGDVVIGTEVIYYDLRKETPKNPIRRGSTIGAPASAVRATQAFLGAHGTPARLSTPDGSAFCVFAGPIGSGEAVITDAASHIRHYLLDFNDKTLAVEMEAAGLGQSVHEMSGTSQTPPDWLVVRGISDLADKRKRDDHQAAAAGNAALTVRELLPFLAPDVPAAAR